jgi:cold-inducible RNA-binding protein
MPRRLLFTTVLQLGFRSQAATAQPALLACLALSGHLVCFKVFARGNALPAFLVQGDSMKNLFVGNMSFQTTSADLKALFEPFGQLARVHVAMDRETGRARGFGFVEMVNDAEAATAIAALDGKDIGGRNIKVNEARPKEAGGGPRSGGGNSGGGYGGDKGGNSGPRGKSGGNKGGGKGRFSNEDYSEVARQPREPRW